MAFINDPEIYHDGETVHLNCEWWLSSGHFTAGHAFKVLRAEPDELGQVKLRDSEGRIICLDPCFFKRSLYRKAVRALFHLR